MTRGKAKEKVQILDYVETHKADYVSEKQVIELIDFVYDDFESRTCENCKYYSHSKNIDNYGVCTNDDIGCLYGSKQSFGCNKFERKIDGNV